MMSGYEQCVTEVAILIDKATADDLTGPEWHLNMLICDSANANDAICDDVVRALQRKLESHSSPRVAMQTLVLAETLVKNGSEAVHAAIGSRAFLQEVAATTDGARGVDVQRKALELIKQWADAFAGSTLTSFQDTYRMLKIQGVVFPEVENDVPVFTPPSSVARAQAQAQPQPQVTYPPPPQLELGAAGTSSRSLDSVASTGTSAAAMSRGASTREQQVAKLHADLEIVTDKMTLYRELKSAGQVTSESMEDVLDFLRQCQPRMNVLIEGGLMGKLDERALEACLNVHDNLIKVLDDAAAGKGAVKPDLMSFESPQRGAAAAEPDLLNGMSAIDLNDRPPPAPAPASHASDLGEFASFMSSRGTQ